MLETPTGNVIGAVTACGSDPDEKDEAAFAAAPIPIPQRDRHVEGEAQARTA